MRNEGMLNLGGLSSYAQYNAVKYIKLQNNEIIINNNKCCNQNFHINKSEFVY